MTSARQKLLHTLVKNAQASTWRTLGANAGKWLAKSAPVATPLATGSLAAYANEKWKGPLGERYGGSTPLAFLLGALPGVAAGTRRGRRLTGMTKNKPVPSKAMPGFFESSERLSIPTSAAVSLGIPTVMAPLTSASLTGEKSLMKDLAEEYRHLREAAPDAGAVLADAPKVLAKARKMTETAAERPMTLAKEVYEGSGAKEQVGNWLNLVGQEAAPAMYDVGGGLLGGTAGTVGGVALARYLFGPKEMGPGERVSETEHKKRSRRRLIADLVGAVLGGVGGAVAGQYGARQILKSQKA